MNYITTNHRGGLGNVMFKLAASISMAIDNGVEYIFSNEFFFSDKIMIALYLVIELDHFHISVWFFADCGNFRFPTHLH